MRKLSGSRSLKAEDHADERNGACMVGARAQPNVSNMARKDFSGRADSSDRCPSLKLTFQDSCLIITTPEKVEASMPASRVCVSAAYKVLQSVISTFRMVRVAEERPLPDFARCLSSANSASEKRTNP